MIERLPDLAYHLEHSGVSRILETAIEASVSFGCELSLCLRIAEYHLK